MKGKLIKVGITQGDINGIGYEIIIKTFIDIRMFEICTPIVYGSPKVASYHRKALNIDNFSFNIIKNVEESNTKRANLINCTDDSVRVELGLNTVSGGEAAFRSLERATQDLKERKIDVLVTSPINKENIQSKQFSFPGHTEYLINAFNAEEALMVMVSEKTKIGVVTGHIPFIRIPIYITMDNILKKLRVLNKALKVDFAIRKPRIAVLGLNPHAGDNGLLGSEENITIIPALKLAEQENISAFGPYPADSFFGTNSFTKFDAILAMYHDQGLAPFKALAFDGGVNYTAGLPVIRTSPAHGTAFDIAGKNIASPSSFRNAIYLACDIFNNRLMEKELTKDTLKSYEISE
jgi:4-hydroxythreonine-4-phosphate dehydrogenase